MNYMAKTLDRGMLREMEGRRLQRGLNDGQMLWHVDPEEYMPGMDHQTFMLPDLERFQNPSETMPNPFAPGMDTKSPAMNYLRDYLMGAF